MLDRLLEPVLKCCAGLSKEWEDGQSSSDLRWQYKKSTVLDPWM
jgi:hypothetical protein